MQAGETAENHNGRRVSAPKWKAGLLNLLTMAVSLVITLLIAEIVLRFLPVATALPVEPPSAENPIQRYVANRPYTWSLDWNMSNVVRGRSNAQGFLADYDYDAADPRPLVAVVGDSFVEALRVSFATSLTGRLQAALGSHGRAYVFAQSGSPLSQYVAYARHACARYRPQRLVVVVVGNDFDESVHANRRRNGIHHLHQRDDGGFDLALTPLPALGLIERVMRRSALALYVARNLKAGSLIELGTGRARAATAERPFVGQTAATADAARLEEGYRVIDWFLGALAPAACLAPRNIVIVLDAPRPELYDADDLAAVQNSYFPTMRRRLIAEAGARGFTVVDMQPRFVAAYQADRRPLELPRDGHWNEHAHALATAAVLEALGDWPPLQAAKAR